MEIVRLAVGQLQTDCYLAFCPKTREAVIIDPGDDGDFIGRRIGDLAIRPKLILVTHGHFDHVLAATELKLAFGIPFAIHPKDLFLLKRLRQTAEHFLGYDACPEEIKGPEVDRFLKEGDVVGFGRERLRVIETPGHTPGSVCFYSSGDEVLFSGDILFYRGIGRTDFSYASPEDLSESLRKLFVLPGETIVYPGHGQETTIGAEGGLDL